MQRHLEAVAPQRVLERGFTMTTDADGRVLRSADAAQRAGQIVTTFADGRVASTVDGETSGAASASHGSAIGSPSLGSAAKRPAPKRKKKSNPAKPDDGGTLFG